MTTEMLSDESKLSLESPAPAVHVPNVVSAQHAEAIVLATGGALPGEVWAYIPETSGRYGVSTEGRVASVRSEKARLLPQQVNSRSGYLYVQYSLDGKHCTRTVHGLVAKAFLGPVPHGQEVCHSNGVRSDARVVNLRYATKSENHADRVLHGTSQHGEGNASAKLTEDQVRTIRSLAAAGYPNSAIAAMGWTSRANVRLIVTRRSWVYVK